MNEENIIDTEMKEVEEVRDEEILEDEVELNEDYSINKELEDIHDALKNHKEHIEEIYRRLDEEKRRGLNMNGNTANAIGALAKWGAIGAIGLALVKRGGSFGLDIPFFHIRVGNGN